MYEKLLENLAHNYLSLPEGRDFRLTNVISAAVEVLTPAKNLGSFSQRNIDKKLLAISKDERIQLSIGIFLKVGKVLSDQELEEILDRANIGSVDGFSEQELSAMAKLLNLSFTVISNPNNWSEFPEKSWHKKW
jgi:hypothetical protein